MIRVSLAWVFLVAATPGLAGQASEEPKSQIFLELAVIEAREDSPVGALLRQWQRGRDDPALATAWANALGLRESPPTPRRGRLTQFVQKLTRQKSGMTRLLRGMKRRDDAKILATPFVLLNDGHETTLSVGGVGFTGHDETFENSFRLVVGAAVQKDGVDLDVRVLSTVELGGSLRVENGKIGVVFVEDEDDPKDRGLHGDEEKRRRTTILVRPRIIAPSPRDPSTRRRAG